MIDLTAERATPALRALFDLAMPTAPRAFAVLNGDVAGQILTDDAARPTSWSAPGPTIRSREVGLAPLVRQLPPGCASSARISTR
jgi:hypothetical protein